LWTYLDERCGLVGCQGYEFTVAQVFLLLGELNVVEDVGTDPQEVFVEVLHVDRLNFFVDHLNLLEEKNVVGINVQELEHLVELLELVEEDFQLGGQLLP